MNKKLVVSVLAVGLVIGFWFAKDLFPKNNQPLISPEPSPLSFLKTKLIEISEVGDKYEIQINYPEFFGSTFPEAEKTANSFLENLFKDQVLRLKSDLIENIADIPGIKSSLGADYKEVLLTGKIASIKFDNYEYTAGAAHPNSFYSVFNYDFEKNRQVNLTELFNPGSDFLPIVSEIAFQDLKNQLVETDPFVQETIKDGLVPIENNFKNFVFNKDKITFLFDPYQLGAYAIGPRSVEISYDQLQDFNDTSELLNLIRK